MNTIKERHFGYIEQELRPKDWIFGGISGVDGEVIRPNGQWDDFLPELEVQKFPWGDSMACVTYSFLNCLETVERSRGVDINFSDRFTAKISGTTHAGNSMRAVADSVINDGLVLESDYGSKAYSWDDYYSALSQDLVKKAKENAKSLDVSYKWVSNQHNVMCEALMFSPLQIATYAYGDVVKGIYQNTGRSSNHCMMLYGYDYGNYWKVYDHYDNAFKKLSWDYYMSQIYQVNIAQHMSNKNPLGLKDNTLAQLVEGKGGVGLFLGDAILTNTLDKVHFAWHMRNKTSDLDERKRTMTQAEWDLYDKKPLP